MSSDTVGDIYRHASECEFGCVSESLRRTVTDRFTHIILSTDLIAHSNEAENVIYKMDCDSYTCIMTLICVWAFGPRSVGGGGVR